MTIEEMKYDLVIVGAGPAGLSTAIRLKHLDKKNNTNHSICIIEKGAEVGSHILSGAILDPVALDELIPNWKELDAPVKTEVKNESFYFFTENNSIKIPNIFLPEDMHNNGINICMEAIPSERNLPIQEFCKKVTNKGILKKEICCPKHIRILEIS